MVKFKRVVPLALCDLSKPSFQKDVPPLFKAMHSKAFILGAQLHEGASSVALGAAGGCGPGGFCPTEECSPSKVAAEAEVAPPEPASE